MNEQRVFGVFFYKNGTKSLVMVDDLIPIASDGEAAFAVASNSVVKNPKVLWVSIIEKAWAKLHGNYFNIQ